MNILLFNSKKMKQREFKLNVQHIQYYCMTLQLIFSNLKNAFLFVVFNVKHWVVNISVEWSEILKQRSTFIKTSFAWNIRRMVLGLLF